MSSKKTIYSNGRESVAIMDKDFMSINQSHFSSVDGKASATKLESIKRDSSRKAGFQLDRERVENRISAKVQKSIKTTEGHKEIFFDLVELGYNKTFEEFKRIHVQPKDGNIIKSKVKGTIKLLEKLSAK